MTFAVNLRNAVCFLVLAWAAASGCAAAPEDPNAVAGGGAPGPYPRTGCAATPTQPIAPGGYYVNGNTICTADGRPHLLHGVDRPSLEWQPAGDGLSQADFALMATWKANVVRIALNQDFWLAASPLRDPAYPALVDSSVAWAEAAGMDVILDLHWSDAGVLGSCAPETGCQKKMADQNSVTFWGEVAARYHNDGRVMFELYNEPHDIPWATWRDGGPVDGYQATGMQQLYEAVRATGAQNLVLIGGVNWAFDLSGVANHRIDGYNIAYATHPYDVGGRTPSTWDHNWGYLTRTDPVVVTEFGNATGSCATAYSDALIKYADSYGASWTAWAWYPGGCKFPAIIDDWNATPSPSGNVVKAALLGYD